MDSTLESQEREEASYSEDFEHDAESQDSPISEEKIEVPVVTIKSSKVLTASGKSGNKTVSETSLRSRSAKPLPNKGLRPDTHLIRKVNPSRENVPVSAAVSSRSISRLSVQGNVAGGGGNVNIRRVVAHTSIKEKSYASAKFKTYSSPPLRVNPPFKIGIPLSNISQRISSAKRVTIMDLKSKVKLLQDEIEKLKKENRFLNRLHHRQDNALKKWEGKDAELPRLLNQHKDEIRSLQEQLRKAQQHAREYTEKLSGRDKKILRLETEVEKLRALVHEEHLQDRHNMKEELDVTRMNLVGAEKRIREYMRHVDILDKNHRHQLAAQERKFIKVNTHTYELQQVVANLKLALRNKDRMLNYIQMRSTGRSLIRAFHAEREPGDDALYGLSVSPVQKSHSLDFGKPSSAATAATTLDNEKQNHDHFNNNDDSRSNKRRLSDGKVFQGQQSYETSSRPSSRVSQSLESIITPAKSLDKAIKQRPENSSDQQPEMGEKSKLKPLIKSILKSGNKLSSGKCNLQPQSEYEKLDDQPILEIKAPDSTTFSVKQTKTTLDGDQSRELLYKGSSMGFKYEGPFMKSSDSDFQKESTEILYSPKSEKRSDDSVCSNETNASSRSELLSNIDILSARIRESCVMVPPLEEQKSNSTSPRVGPGGDGSAVTVAEFEQPSSSESYQKRLLHQIQLYSKSNHREASSIKSQQAFISTSPRLQINSVSLPSVSTTQQQICSNSVAGSADQQTIIDSQYSPRLVAVVAEPQAQHASSDFPYFSFTATQSVPQPTSVTIIQTNPVYDHQTTSSSPQAGYYATPPKSTTFPTLGYSFGSSDCDQTFPNPNQNTKSNQSGYNPSYYVNLGSWK